MMIAKLYGSDSKILIFPWPFNKTVGEYLLLNKTILVDASSNQINDTAAKLMISGKDPYTAYNIYSAKKASGAMDGAMDGAMNKTIFNLTYNYANYIGYCSWLFLINTSTIYYFIGWASTTCSVT